MAWQDSSTVRSDFLTWARGRGHFFASHDAAGNRATPCPSLPGQKRIGPLRDPCEKAS
jgi:hypothetical protein